MARTINRLSAVAVRNASKPGMVADGAGLYLHVSDTGAKSWIFRYMLSGKRRDMGLGSTYTITLAEARAKGVELRKQLLDKVDPITERDAERIQQGLSQAKRLTFAEVAEQWLTVHRDSWSNAKHVYQNEMQLRKIAGNVIGSLPVQSVDTDQIMRVLQPIWRTKTETANRVRNKIEAVLDFAKVSGYREGENPARWKGHLDHLLPSQSKVRDIEHMAALPYLEIAAFLKKLSGLEGCSARALEFLIFNATRTSETLSASWAEINLEQQHWTIPGRRMKGRRDHRIPLSSQALSVLERVRPKIGKMDGFVFPGSRDGRPLSNMALIMQMRRLDHGSVTVHGFRSTFRTWAGESTEFAREVIEAALAHVVGNQVENAYWRGDMYDRRRMLMNDWGAFCASAFAPQNVFPEQS